MKTPKEKYHNDPEYRRLVDMLTSFIHNAQFTPSELREASIFACINYEMSQCRTVVIPPHIREHLKSLEEWAQADSRE